MNEALVCAFTSSLNMHAFRFKSDDTINSKGFSASYTIIDQADNKVKRREMTTFIHFSFHINNLDFFMSI